MVYVAPERMQQMPIPLVLPSDFAALEFPSLPDSASENKKAPENQGLRRISLPAIAGLCRLENHSHSIIFRRRKPLIIMKICNSCESDTIKNTINFMALQ